MIAAFCLLFPALVSVFIRSKLFSNQKSLFQKILQYFAYVLAINGIILVLLLIFFTNGDHLIYNLNHQAVFALKYIALAMVIAIAEPLSEKFFNIKHISTVTKVTAFLLFLVVGFSIINFIVQPIWQSYNYNVTHGIYTEQENSIETLFLGTSHIFYGVSPMELYEEYGICAYNISTNSQPTAASYYWLEEVYRLNSETLDTVVYDVSYLRQNPGISYYHEAIDPMHFSSIKLQAVGSFSENFTDFISNLFPMFSYHERWKELTDEDFLKYSKEPESYLRGYYFSTSQWCNSSTNYYDINIPLLEYNENEEEILLDDTALKYFDYMVSFCEDHNIQLVLIKTPTEWSSGNHNAVQKLADNYELDFIDFNVNPYYSDIGFDLAANVIYPSDKNNLHANYYGAKKITDYLGEYLIEKCGNRDVRGDENYAFMDSELEDYNRYIVKINLDEIKGPRKYLSYLLSQDNYEIFISVKGDGSHSLTKKQREYFSSIGLKQLASLEDFDSYLAIIDDGEVISEKLGKYNEESDNNAEQEEASEALSVSENGVLADVLSYKLLSCGGITAAESSCILDGTEYSPNSQGINFVVYDKKLQKVVDNVAFDTHTSSTRDPLNVEEALSNDRSNEVKYENLSVNGKKLYRYDILCRAKLAEKTSTEDGLLNYFSYFWNDENYSIIISAKGDASSALSEDVRTFLYDIGLEQLSELQYRDSYIAIISGGEVLVEQRSDAEDPIEISWPGYTVISGCHDTNNKSSIKINKTEYSPNERGLNIVVINNLDSRVLSTKSFDTFEITQSLPDNWPS